MQRLLIDANLVLGFLNVKDKYHEKCLRFFQGVNDKIKRGKKIQVIIPLHLAVEVNIKIRKKKRNNDWENFPNIEACGPEFYPIDSKFINEVQNQKLYDKFDKLSAMDAIYAMIAYIEKIPLVTADRDFEKVKDIVEIKFI